MNCKYWCMLLTRLCSNIKWSVTWIVNQTLTDACVMIFWCVTKNPWRGVLFSPTSWHLLFLTNLFKPGEKDFYWYVIALIASALVPSGPGAFKFLTYSIALQISFWQAFCSVCGKCWSQVAMDLHLEKSLKGSGLGMDDTDDGLLPIQQVPPPPFHVTDVIQGKARAHAVWHQYHCLSCQNNAEVGNELP